MSSATSTSEYGLTGGGMAHHLPLCVGRCDGSGARPEAQAHRKPKAAECTYKHHSLSKGASHVYTIARVEYAMVYTCGQNMTPRYAYSSSRGCLIHRIPDSNPNESGTRVKMGMHNVYPTARECAATTVRTVLRQVQGRVFALHTIGRWIAYGSRQ